MLILGFRKGQYITVQMQYDNEDGFVIFDILDDKVVTRRLECVESEVVIRRRRTRPTDL